MGRSQAAIYSTALFMLISCVATSPVQKSLPDLKTISNRINNEDYLLPKNVKPKDYVITLTPDFDTFTFEGEVAITVAVVNETSSISLHCNIMNITDVSVTDAESREMISSPITENSYNEETKIYTINLQSNAEANGVYTVTIVYTGYLLDDMNGFYRSKYTTQDGQEKWLATTQFESTGARRAFPCFDEPAFKATFQINIIRTNDRKSISNSKLERTEVVNETAGTYKDVFAKTPAMSTYLVAFIVSDFEDFSLTMGGRKYSVWAKPDAISEAAYSLAVSPQLLEFMERFTAIKFEFDKMEEAAIPDFSAGAMENWGLVTYRERMLLYSKSESTTANKQSIATTIAHEFSHQWFGDLVSPAWWKYLWLNEGFATYFEYFATASVEPDWRLDEQFVVDTVQNALAVDAQRGTHPITVDVYSPQQIESIFDRIEYDKAGSVIRSMEHFLSTKTFKAALTNYLNHNNHGNAEASDLFNEIQEQQEIDRSLPTGLNAVEILNSWTLQSGYPVISVTRYDDGVVHVSQKRFFISEKDDTDETLWYVPISYTTSSQPDFETTSPKEWLENVPEKNLTSINVTEEEWIVLNIQETGFYRVLYDNDNYQLLTEFLKSENYKDIHTINRAQIIDDSLNLARAGLLEYATALDLSEYLTQEIDYIPWASYFTAIAFLEQRFVGTPVYEPFKEYVLLLLENLYNSVGFKTSESDSHVDKLNRVNVLTKACNYGHEDCISQASALFAANQANNEIISPDLRSVVYCTGVRNGGQEEWDFLWEKYLSTDLNSEQVIILNSLACSENTTVLNEYLEKTITADSGIRPQDNVAVVQAVAAKPEGTNVALDFLINNYGAIKTGYTTMNAVSSVISTIAARLTTQEQYVKLIKFIIQNLSELSSTGPSVLNTVDKNLQWYKTYSTDILSWLETTSTTSSMDSTTDESTPTETTTTDDTTTDDSTTPPTSPTPPPTSPTPPSTSPTPPPTTETTNTSGSTTTIATTADPNKASGLSISIPISIVTICSIAFMNL